VPGQALGRNEGEGAAVLLEAAADLRDDREVALRIDDAVLVEGDFDPGVGRHIVVVSRGSVAETWSGWCAWNAHESRVRPSGAVSLNR
jgi:hypothetical protein